MMSWPLRKLGDIAKINPEQLGNSTALDYRLEYLDISGIARPGTIGATTSYCYSDAPSRARRKVIDGDLLVSTVRPYLRAFARVQCPPANLVASTGFAVVRPNSNVSGEFLFQHILSEKFTAYLTPLMRGGSYPAVGADDVSSYRLPLPPLPEQRKIAAILSSVDDAIETTQAVIEQLQVVKKAMMAELLTRGIPGRHTKFKMTEIGEVPEEWVVVRLDDLVEPTRPIAYGILKPGEFVASGVPMLRISDIKGGQAKIENVHRVSDSLSREYTRTILRGGETVISLVGTIGVVANIPNAYAGANVHRNLGVIAPNKRITPQFLSLSMAGPQFQDQISSVTKGGNQPLLNLGDLRERYLSVPKTDEQVQIVETITTTTIRYQSELDQLKTLRTLKSSLMSVLLTGELRVKPEITQ